MSQGYNHHICSYRLSQQVEFRASSVAFALLSVIVDVDLDACKGSAAPRADVLENELAYAGAGKPDVNRA